MSLNTARDESQLVNSLRGMTGITAKLQKVGRLRATFRNWIRLSFLVGLSMLFSRLPFGRLAAVFASRRVTLRLKGRSLRLDVPVLDVWPAVEVFALGEYDLRELRWNTAAYVLDLGANAGAFSVWASTRTNCSVMALEPNPDAYRMLERNVANLNSRVFTLEAAVTGLEGERTLFDAGQTATASLKKANAPSRQFKVRGVTLQSAIAISGFPRVDVLKMDIEGSEQEVLMASSDTTLELIRAAVIECHDFLGTDTDLVVRRLTQAGMNVVRDNRKGLPLLVAWR